MTDYIKREDAIKWLKNLFDDCGNYMPLWHYGEVLPKIIELLEVDVAPVRHGRWTETSYDEYQCSVCKKVVREEILYAIKPSDREDASMYVANYCPNCGAKMDEEDTAQWTE